MAHKTSNKDGEKNTVVAPGDHNFASQVEVINSTCKKLYDLEEQERAAILKHVKPIRDEKREVKLDMKTKTEIDTKYFNTILYKPYKIQEDVKKFEEVDRKKVQTDISVLFDAAGQGSMLDHLTEHVADKIAASNKPKKVDAKSPDDLPGDDEGSEPDEDGAEESTDDSGDAEESTETPENDQL